MDFTELFVDVDDFWKVFKLCYQRRLLKDGVRQRRREPRLSLSEVMTILIAFQTSNYRTFKHYYLHLLACHRHDFPDLVRYGRFVELIPQVPVPLFAYLWRRCRGQVTGISFIDSTALRVCHPKRITRHRVFQGLAAMGKSSMGWFYGFKLHLVINDRGELLGLSLTPGNVDDREPIPVLTRDLWGWLFGDKGYISQRWFEKLLARGLKLVTHLRRNMKGRLIDVAESLLLRKRSLIETVIDQLKNVCQIEHSRHRSPINALVHLLAGLIAYAKKPKTPSLNLDLPIDQPLLVIA